MTPTRLAIPLQISASAARPTPVSLSLDVGDLASTAAGRATRVSLASARLLRGEGRYEAKLEARALDGDDARQPVRFSWLEGVDVHVAHTLELDLAADGDEEPAPSPLAFPRVRFVPQPDALLEGTVDGRVVLA